MARSPETVPNKTKTLATLSLALFVMRRDGLIKWARCGKMNILTTALHGTLAKRQFIVREEV